MRALLDILFKLRISEKVLSLISKSGEIQYTSFNVKLYFFYNEST